MKLYPNVTLLFVIWVFGVFTIFFFGFSNFPHSQKFSDNFWQNLANWDGGHYLGIAEHGYSEDFQYAFFPLYALTIRFVHQITQNYLLAAILISLLATFLGVQLLYKLISQNFDKKLAEKVVFGLLIFPASFYFLTAYSEGLFFLLVLATFYFLRQNKIFWAVISAALASSIRLVGLAVVLGLILEVHKTWGFNRKNWYVILSPLGFLAYAWYLYNQTGDPFYFITAEDHWQRVLSIPAMGFWETIKSLVQPGFIIKNFNVFLDLIFAIFGLGIVMRAFRFLPLSWAVYGLVSIVLPLFTPSLSSMPRFLLPIFPIFISIALIKNRHAWFFYQMISLMLLASFTILFINGYWVS